MHRFCPKCRDMSLQNVKCQFVQFPQIKSQQGEKQMKARDDSCASQNFASDDGSYSRTDVRTRLAEALLWADKRQLAELLLENPKVAKHFIGLLLRVDASGEEIDPGYYIPYEPPEDLLSVLFY
jgi:hypothetical protein